MRNLKVVFLSIFVASLFMTSCQKEKTDQQFEQNLVEQSEEIADTPEDLTQEKTAPQLSEKQLETSGIKSYLDRPENELKRKGEGDRAVARSGSWVECGDSFFSTTVGAGNHYNGHTYQAGCLDKFYAFDAPDKKYYLYIPEVMDVTFELSNMNKDLDLFIFTADWWYNPHHCIAYSVNPYNNAEKMTIKMNPGVYVILIDGYKYNQAGQFKFKITCDTGCEDFDNYANGNISSQSADWCKWVPGAAFDGKVTNNRSYSPTKSLFIDHKAGYSNANQMDVVKKIGEYTSGRYFIKWKMYVPHNRNAAFNFQKFNIPGLETGLVVYLRKGKGIALRANNQIFQSSKSYSQGEWIDISVDYDISGGIAVLHVDDKMIAIWDTNIRNNTPVHGTNRLGGIDFWAYHDYTTFYVDDLCVEDLSGIIIDYIYDPAAIYIDVL